MSKLILESLDKTRLSIFNKLVNFKNVGVLGGGTALALQIGHRISYDFDIFTKEKIGKDVWKKAKTTFGNGSVKTLDTKDQLNLITPESISVTFFFDDYKSLFEPIKTNVINLMAIKDIAANKAFIQGKRPKWRDYVDLYFLLRDKYMDLAELIRVCLKKFGNDFSEKLFLEQLVYWDDIGNYEIQLLGKKIEPEEIKEFLKSTVKNFLK